MALPPTIAHIVSMIGHGPAMALVAEFGGQDFRFPRSRKGDVWESLVEVVGPKAAARLVEHYRGNEIYIARCARALREDRNRQIIQRYDALLADGHSSRGAVSILVREFPMSNRQIENIVNGPAPIGPSELVVQGQLF